MSKNWGDYDVSALRDYTNDLNLVGLEEFRNKLEKHFFAHVSIRKCVTCRIQEVRLVIEVKGTISFEHSVKHFRTDVIGDPGYNSKSLMKMVAELQSANSQLIDIEELALMMSDTSIIVQRVGNLSVARQYDNIMRIVMNDYKYIVSQTMERPLEIHIPVLEFYDNQENTNTFLSGVEKRIGDRYYFNYWAVYYDSADTLIYDVENSKLISEEIVCLPQ